MYNVGVAAFFWGIMTFVSVYITDQAQSVAIDNWCSNGNRNSGLNSSEAVAAYRQCQRSGWAVAFKTDGLCVGAAGKTNSSCVDSGGQWQPTWIVEAGVVWFLGTSMNYSAVYNVATVVSTILQLLLFASLGSLADFGGLRKLLFTLSNSVSAVTVGLIWFGGAASAYDFNSWMIIISNTLLNFSSIMFNGWLPLLTASHPMLLDDPRASQDEVVAYGLRNKVSTYLSGTSTAALFIGAVAFLILSVILFMTLTIDQGVIVRILCILCMIWLLVFCSITSFVVLPRPGPPLPKDKNLFQASFMNIISTISRIRKQKHGMIFLLSYFIYSDGISTMANASAIFASNELQLDFTNLIIALLLSAVMSGISSLLAHPLQKRFSCVSSKWVLFLCLLGMGLLPLYAIFALTSAVEFMIVATLFGGMSGFANVFGLSIFSANIVCLGRESGYFSVWQLTAQGSSWLGPLLLSAIATSTGSFRKAFSSLVIFMWLGALILFFFDPTCASNEKSKLELEDCKARESVELIVQAQSRPEPSRSARSV